MGFPFDTTKGVTLDPFHVKQLQNWEIRKFHDNIIPIVLNIIENQYVELNTTMATHRSDEINNILDHWMVRKNTTLNINSHPPNFKLENYYRNIQYNILISIKYQKET